MPAYDYYCETNGKTVEVTHPAGKKLRFWAEVCYYAQIRLGDTDPEAAVKMVISRAPSVSIPKFNSELRNIGFTRLEKRDDGIYENVTATDRESRYMKRGDASTLPDIKGRIAD